MDVLSVLRSMRCQYVQLQWIGRHIPVFSIAALLKEYGMLAVGVQDKAGQVFSSQKYFLDLCRQSGGWDICLSGAREIGETIFIEKVQALRQCTDTDGLSLSYHPTGADFTKTMHAVLEACPFLRLTLDTCQAFDAQADTAKLIEQYAGRIDCVHLKDRDSSGRLCPVGQGVIGFERILSACSGAGVKYLLAEQETWEDAFKELGEGFRYVSALCEKYARST